ncbi:hypothetical protein, partial [Nostoc sp.]|uniref:hypothetical protein n=1 Tax=Nostoc sp. TaxID=1180 RepID=UPI002FFB97A0
WLSLFSLRYHCPNHKWSNFSLYHKRLLQEFYIGVGCDDYTILLLPGNFSTLIPDLKKSS